MSLSKERTGLYRLSKTKDEMLVQLLRIFSYDDDDSLGGPLGALQSEVQQLMTRDSKESDEEFETKMKGTVSLLERIRPVAKINFKLQPPSVKRKPLVICIENRNIVM